jgi:hypothetical protein
MIRKSYFFTLFSFLFSLYTFAQENAGISFSSVSYNFGDIKEDAGPVEYEFSFTNTGNVPLVINSVSASCGCTTPGWSQDSIMPGKTGFVKASYDPFNRPGDFNKTLAVTSNTDPAITVLTIAGYVKPKQRTVDEDLPLSVGKLRVRYKTFNFGNITTKEPLLKEFEVYNDSDSAISFSEKVTAPEHLKLMFEPRVLKPKERGKIWVRYDAKLKNDYGFVSDNVVFYTSEKLNSEKNFSVYATIEEYFPPLNEFEKANAPNLSFNGVLYDFGTVKKGQVLSIDFPFANIGGADVNIRSIKTNCACTIAKVGKKDIKPGDSSSISVQFDTSGREGTQIKTFAVFSNDPLKPTQVLTIKAIVR